MTTYTITRDMSVGATNQFGYQQIILPRGTVCKKTGTSNTMKRHNVPVVSCTVNGVDYTNIVLDVSEEGPYYQGGANAGIKNQRRFEKTVVVLPDADIKPL